MGTKLIKGPFTTQEYSFSTAIIPLTHHRLYVVVRSVFPEPQDVGVNSVEPLILKAFPSLPAWRLLPWQPLRLRWSQQIGQVAKVYSTD